MKRVVHVSRSHEEAREWDIEQHVSMTREERLEAARQLKERAYGTDNPDVREWHRRESAPQD